MNTYNPYVNQHFSYAWIMLTTSGSYHWVQVGNSDDGTRYTRIQYADGAGDIDGWDFSPNAVGSYHTFRIWWHSDINFTVQMDGTNLVGPLYLSWAPTGAQINGELWGFNNQMMGAAQSRQAFNSNQINMSGTLSAYAGDGPLTSTTNPSHPFLGNDFSFSGVPASFRIWDAKCAGT